MAKHLEIREKRRQRRKKQRLTTIMMIIGVVLIFTAILMIPTIQSLINPGGNYSLPEEVSRTSVNANTAGNPEAPVTIKIFSDFGCGHCGNFALSTGQELFKRYVSNDLVYLEYNSVGSMLGHPNSLTTAEAAYCAGDQNRFWDYHDMLYTNQAVLFASMNQTADRTLIAYAEALGLDGDEFSDCLESKRYQEEVAEDFNEALDAGVSSTPTFFVNDKQLIGNIPIEEFQREIDFALAKADLDT